MKLSQLTLLAAAALLLIGCSQSPKDAIYGMYDALADGDIQKLKENTTDTTSGLLIMASMMKCDANKNDFSSKDEIASYCMEEMFSQVDIDSVEITEASDTKAYAMVTSTDNGQENSERFELIKVGDTWKVNMHK